MEALTPATEKADELAADHASFEAKGEALPIPRLRQALDDLFTPNPTRYRLDLFGSLLCFYGGLAAAALPLPLAARLLAFALSSLGLLSRDHLYSRAGAFSARTDARFPPGLEPLLRPAGPRARLLIRIACRSSSAIHLRHRRRRRVLAVGQTRQPVRDRVVCRFKSAGAALRHRAVRRSRAAVVAEPEAAPLAGCGTARRWWSTQAIAARRPPRPRIGAGERMR